MNLSRDRKFSNKSRGREHARFVWVRYFQNAADCYLMLFLNRNLMAVWTFLLHLFNDKAMTCLSCLEMMSKGWWAAERVLHGFCVALKARGLNFRFCLSAECKMTAQTLVSLSRVSFLSSLSNFLEQQRVRWVTALTIYFNYDIYINSVLHNLVYELNKRLWNQLTSLHLWGCTLMALPYILQVCVYIHPVQMCAVFQLLKVNGQNLINRRE